MRTHRPNEAPKGAERSLARQRGFSLAEGLICIAVFCGSALALMGAVAQGLHNSGSAAERERLTSDALDVLADLRIATAYDSALLTQSTGRHSKRVAVFPTSGGAVRRVTFDVAITKPAGSARVYLADVTATAEDGTSVSEERDLTNEAPPPGATIDTNGNIVDSSATP